MTVGGILEGNRSPKAGLRFVQQLQRRQVKSQDVVALRLIWLDSQNLANQFNGLSRLAGLMSDDPKQVQGFGVAGNGFEDFLAKLARLRQTSGVMKIQRLLEQIVSMLVQGLPRVVPI
jgi:hypothetical protein